MKGSTIRLIVILAALSIVGITITQIYWVIRAFDLKETEFNHTVNSALNNVAQQIFEINKTPSPAVNPVNQISTNYFVVLLNSDIDASLLEFLLQTEFEKRNLKVDFEYGLYDCSSKCMIYGDYVPLVKTKQIATTKIFPNWATEANHFGIRFPNHEAHILNQMGIWTFSSVVLMLVIIFFAYTLFVILKQKRLSEIQKDFINNMTHEFKTPISTIALSTEVLKDAGIVYQPERLLSYTTIIEKENTRLKHQVERVLQMAKLDKDDIGLKLETANIHQLIQEAVRNISMTAHERNATIQCEFQAVNHQLSADKLHITNVFHNLLDNAIKYCCENPCITISTSNHAKNLIIEFSDNGLGIAEEHRKRIFQKFYRVPTGDVHDVKGFGLGLSYVKSIVEAHKGKVSVASSLGKGSVFKICLPL